MKDLCNSIVIETAQMRLTLSKSGYAESLICKANGEECLDQTERVPLCSVTEDRPYNNEIKLAYPNKRMTFASNRLYLRDGHLIVGFELIRFEAEIAVEERDGYVTFRLIDFPMDDEAFGNLFMDRPPVASMRLLQLPVQKRAKFGEWLNVVSDDKIAVGVLATSPYESIDSYRQKNAIVLTAEAEREVKIKGCTAALIVSPADLLLDHIEMLEKDFSLPRGVESRRSEHINRSIYWSSNVNPTNVERHIAYAKQSGLTHMLLYYSSVFKESGGYALCGNYDYRDEYPNGKESLTEMLNQLKAAGITPGIHFLHPHIGIKSRYVTPVADHRLNLKRHLTLSKPLDKSDTTVYVEENPQGSPMYDRCRNLKFGGELISYEAYTTEPPYCFTGCQRGYYETNVIDHELGQIGGILDVCEFSATSVYLDQNSGLQDEVADKLADAYNAGFEFIYFDGSEGTNPPFNHHVSNAQYRVLKKLKRPPLFCSGAAKSHFGWHYMSGGNAFDVFPAPVFKQKLVEFPFEEAPRMAQDFTALNFGWWSYHHSMMPDMYEYGNALAFAWDCPTTVMINDLNVIDSHPRTKDNLEVMRRWEEARVKQLFSNEQKLALRNHEQEHILLINEQGEYELTPYDRIENAAGGNRDLTAYVLCRREKTYVVLFHNTGEGTLTLPLPAEQLLYEAELGGEQLPLTATDSGTELTVNNRHYLSTALDRDTVVRAIQAAKM